MYELLQHTNVQCEVPLPVGSYKYENEDLVLHNQIPELEPGTLFTHSIMPVIKTVII